MVEKPFDGTYGEKLIHVNKEQHAVTEKRKNVKMDAAYETAMRGAFDLIKDIWDKDRKRITLRPDQKEIFDTKDESIRVLAAGRRYGKTTLAIAIVVDYAAQHKNALIWWVAPTYEQCYKAKTVIEHILKDIGLLVPKGKRKKRGDWHTELVSKNGCEIHYKSAHDSDNLRGEGVNLLIIDEMINLKERDLSHVLMPMILDTQGQFVMISSKDREEGVFYKTWLEGQEGQYKIKGITSWERLSTLNTKVSTKELTLYRAMFPLEAAIETGEAWNKAGEHVFNQELKLKLARGEEGWTGKRLDPRTLVIDGSGVGKCGWIYGEGAHIVASGSEQMTITKLYPFTDELLKKFDPQVLAIDATGNTNGHHGHVATEFEKMTEEGDVPPELACCHFNSPSTSDRYANWRTEFFYALIGDVGEGMFSLEEGEHRELLSELGVVLVLKNESGKLYAKKRVHKADDHNEDLVDALIMYAKTVKEWWYLHPVIEAHIVEKSDKEAEEDWLRNRYRRRVRTGVNIFV